MKMKIWKNALLMLLLAGFGLMAQAQSTPGAPRTPRTPRAPGTSRSSWTNSGGTYMSIDEDSSVSPVQTLITYRNGPLYIMTLENEKLVDLYVNGRKIPADSFAVYNHLVEKILVQMKKDREQARLDRIQAEKDRAQAEIDRQQADKDRQQAVRDRAQAGKDREQADKDRVQAIKDRGQAERDRQQALQDAGRAREDSKRSEQDRGQAGNDREQALKDATQAEKDRQQAILDRAQADRDREQAVRDRAQAEKDREQAGRDRIQAEKDRKQAEIDRALMKSMMEEIVKDGIVPDEKSVRSVELDEDALFINGKKQTDVLHEKYKTKYVKTPSGRISVHKGGMSYSN